MNMSATLGKENLTEMKVAKLKRDSNTALTGLEMATATFFLTQTWHMTMKMVGGKSCWGSHYKAPIIVYEYLQAKFCGVHEKIIH